MKKFFVFSLCFFFLSITNIFSQVDAKVPEGKVQVIDNFENGNFWIWAGDDWDKWNDHKISSGANLSKKWVTEGKYSMELLTDPILSWTMKNPAGAVWFYDGSQDLSGGQYIVADFYNPGLVDYETSFAIQVTDIWDWKETARYVIPKGKHTVVYYVGDINKDFNDVRRINISSRMYQNTNVDTVLYVDNIRLIR